MSNDLKGKQNMIKFDRFAFIKDLGSKVFAFIEEASNGEVIGTPSMF